MIKVTNKELKRLANLNYVEDLTDRSGEDVKLLLDLRKLKVIYYSHGAHGINGLAMLDEYCNMYVITKRNSNLFRFI